MPAEEPALSVCHETKMLAFYRACRRAGSLFRSEYVNGIMKRTVMAVTAMNGWIFQELSSTMLLHGMVDRLDLCTGQELGLQRLE